MQQVSLPKEEEEKKDEEGEIKSKDEKEEKDLENK